jgi:hypothetical protein
MSDLFGIEVRGPNNSTPVLSSRLRSSNVVLFSTFSLEGNDSLTFVCPDANDSTKVALTLMGPDSPFPVYLRGVVVSEKTTSGFTLTNYDQATRSGRVLAFRIS